MHFITSKWKARITALLIGIVFCAVYYLTLNQGVFPGESARQVAIALRLEPGMTHTQLRQVEQHSIRSFDNETKISSLSIRETTVPYQTKNVLWRLAGRGLLSVPYKDTIFMLNLFPAVCGAFCAMLAFALCRTLLLFLSFHECPLSARLRKNAAFFSGIAGAAALCTSIPFWLASTRFLPQSFETMLILLTGWLLLSAVISHKVFPLFIFGVLLGAGLFETETGVYMFPIWIFFTVRGMLAGDLTDSRGWASLLVGFALGITAYLCLTQVLLAKESVPLMLPMKEMLATTKVFRSLLIGGSLFEDQAKVVGLCFGIIPFIAAVAMSIWSNNENASSSGGFLLFVLGCTVAIACSGIQVSPWGAYSNTNGAVLPTTIYMMNAYVAAYLVGQGLLMAGGRFFSPSRKSCRRKYLQLSDDDEGNIRSEEHRDYPVGRLLSAFILCIVFFLVPWNRNVVGDWADPMPDWIGKVFNSEHTLPCTWFVSGEDMLDSHIRIYSRFANRRLAVVSTADNEDTIARLSRALTRDPAFNGLPVAEMRNALVSTNSSLFFATWINTDTNIAQKLISAAPDDWLAASKVALPAVVGYKTVNNGATIDWPAVAADHIAFLKKMQEFPPLGKHAPAWLRQNRAEIRQYEFGIGRYLAGSLNDAKQTELARDVLALAEDIREEPVREKNSYDPYDLY